MSKNSPTRKHPLFTTLRKANAEALARALGASCIIREKALAEQLDMPVEDVRLALNDLAVAKRYRYEVQDIVRMARRVEIRKGTA